MRFSTKVAVVLRTDLATWQKLNLTAFLAGGLGGSLHVPRSCRHDRDRLNRF